MQKFMLQNHNIAVTVLALVSVAPASLLAADAPAPAGPKLSEILDASGITATGYVAGSYYHSTGYNTFHQFDIEHDTFQLDQAGLAVAYQPKAGFGALVSVIAGQDARIVNLAEGNSPGTFNVTQAFVQYATGPLTVIGGKFVTLAGAEVIAPTGNTNFSRSLLFFAEPLTHTGLRATYAASDTVSVIVGINNGWNLAATSFGSKTGEFGIALTPSKKFSLTAQAYVGKDPTVRALRTEVDTVATFTATDTLSFVVSYDRGKQEQQAGPGLKWTGVAGYVNVALTDQLRLSVRGEYFDDKDGFMTATPQKIKEGTVTLGYAPAKSFELRIEGRYDKSDRGTFVKTVNAAGAPLAFDDHQAEFALQGLYKF